MTFSEDSGVRAAISLWPLTKETGVKDILTDEDFTNAVNIGFDPRWTPAGLVGSAIFSGNWLPQNSHIVVSSSNSSHFVTEEISLLAWILIEGSIKGSNMTLFDFRDAVASQNLRIRIINEVISIDIFSLANESFTMSTPCTQFIF